MGMRRRLQQPPWPPPPRLDFSACDHPAVRGRLSRPVPRLAPAAARIDCVPAIAAGSPGLGSVSSSEGALCLRDLHPLSALGGFEVGAKGERKELCGGELGAAGCLVSRAGGYGHCLQAAFCDADAPAFSRSASAYRSLASLGRGRTYEVCVGQGGGGGGATVELDIQRHASEGVSLLDRGGGHEGIIGKSSSEKNGEEPADEVERKAALVDECQGSFDRASVEHGGTDSIGVVQRLRAKAESNDQNGMLEALTLLDEDEGPKGVKPSAEENGEGTADEMKPAAIFVDKREELSPTRQDANETPSSLSEQVSNPEKYLHFLGEKSDTFSDGQVIVDSTTLESADNNDFNGMKTSGLLADETGNSVNGDGGDWETSFSIELDEHGQQLEEGEVSGEWREHDRESPEESAPGWACNGDALEIGKCLFEGSTCSQQIPTVCSIEGVDDAMVILPVPASYPHYHTRSYTRKGRPEEQDWRSKSGDACQKQIGKKKKRKKKAAKKEQKLKVDANCKGTCRKQKRMHKEIETSQEQAMKRAHKGQAKEVDEKRTHKVPKLVSSAPSDAPEEGEVLPLPERKKGILSLLVESEVGLWTTDAGNDQIFAIESEEGNGKKKKRGPLTAERKKARQRAKHIKRAAKENALGIRRLKLKPPDKKVIPLCQFYIKGKCNKGEKCTFSHNTVPQTKSEICKYFLNRCCLKGDDCPFSHDLSSLPCKYFHARGFCLDGAACRFSHKPITEEAYQELLKQVDQEHRARSEIGQSLKDSQDSCMTHFSSVNDWHGSHVAPGEVEMQRPIVNYSAVNENKETKTGVLLAKDTSESYVSSSFSEGDAYRDMDGNAMLLATGNTFSMMPTTARDSHVGRSFETSRIPVSGQIVSTCKMGSIVPLDTVTGGNETKIFSDSVNEENKNFSGNAVLLAARKALSMVTATATGNGRTRVPSRTFRTLHVGSRGKMGGIAEAVQASAPLETAVKIPDFSTSGMNEISTFQFLQTVSPIQDQNEKFPLPVDQCTHTGMEEGSEAAQQLESLESVANVPGASTGGMTKVSALELLKTICPAEDQHAKSLQPTLGIKFVSDSGLVTNIPINLSRGAATTNSSRHVSTESLLNTVLLS